MIKGNILDSTFVSGFCNWKDGTRCFTKHESTAAHKAAADFTINITLTRNLGDLISTDHTKQKASNRCYMLKVAENIQFLARQGIALRGDGTNFMQLMHLCAIDDPKVQDMLGKKTDEYTSPQIQNEINHVTIHFKKYCFIYSACKIFFLDG